MRIAILDDYQSVALSMADWSVLPAGVEVVSFRDHLHDEDALVARLEDFDAISRMRERTEFPRRVLERLPQLKLLLATGRRNSDTIDLAAATELGITVCSTASIPCFPVELTWGLVLALFRRIPFEHAAVQGGRWQSGLGRGLNGRTLGVVGLGTIGLPVARIGQAFGMEVIAWSRNLTAERTAEAGAARVSKEELLERSDAVTLHVPLTPQSTHLIGEAELARMKSDAYLINTSRGPLIDEAALVRALKGRRIGGAGLDVFDVEPLPAEHPLRGLDNAVLTPHIGYVTEDNYRVYFTQTVENIQAYLAGKPMRVLMPGDKVLNFAH